MISPVGPHPPSKAPAPNPFAKLRDLEWHRAFKRVKQHQHVVPDALFLLKIGTADGKTKGGTLVPLFRLLRSATGVKPADLQPVAPVFTSQQRLRRAQGNQPTGKVAQLLVVFREPFPVYP